MLINKLQKIDAAALADVNEDAAQILSNVVMAYKAIMSARATMDAQGHHDQPLHIVVGEQHQRPAHKIFQALLIKALSQSDADGALAVGLENDRTIGNCDSSLFKIKAALRKVTNKSDSAINPKTPAMLNNYLDYHFTNDSYYATHQLISQLLGSSAHIATEFNDACFNTGRSHISESEKYTASCVNEAKGLGHTNLEATSEDGMFIRNLCMTKRIDEMATEYNARLSVQICGQGHVNGLKDIWSHETSISAIHKNKDRAFLSIFTASDAAHLTGLSPAQYFVCAPMSLYQARYAPAEAEGGLHRAEQTKEINFVNAINRLLDI